MSATAGTRRGKSDGKKARKANGKRSRNKGDGTCCCDETSCADCPALDLGCAFCTDFTPALWHVTYLGVEIAMPCTDCGTNFLSFGFLGTYTLDGRVPFDGCVWTGQSGTRSGCDPACSGNGIPTGAAGCPDAYFGYGFGFTDEEGVEHPFFCGPPFGPDQVTGSDRHVLLKEAGTLSLTALAEDCRPFANDLTHETGYSGTFFQSTIEADSCCQDYVLDNENVVYACPTGFDTDIGRTYSGVFGINGSAHLSLC